MSLTKGPATDAPVHPYQAHESWSVIDVELGKLHSRRPIVDPTHIEAIPFPAQADSPLDVWDLACAPSGEIYASLSPMHEPGSPRLYRFDVVRKSMDLIFDFRELTFLPRRAIPASKIHTSMAFADDDTLLMVTHTTAPAPAHEVWAPLSCFHDLYEGFPGSHLLRLDTRSGEARSLGVPVPRESLWGGSCYLTRTGEYLAIGLLRGHLYSIRVSDMSVVDLGYVGRGCRLFQDGGGRAYGISPVGSRSRAIMYRYDPARRTIEDLGVELPRSRGASLAFACVGPEGRVYLARNFYDPFWNLDAVVDDEATDRIFAFDPDSERVDDLGSAFPGARDLPYPAEPRIRRRIVVGPIFLTDGCLYCGVLGGSLDGLVALVRWDVLARAEPEFLGFLHSSGAVVPFVWDSVAGSDGRLYFAEASAGVFATRPELIGIDATRLDSVDVSSSSVETRFENPPRFDAEVRARAERYARKADPNMRSRRVHRIELYDRLLGAEACEVTGMIRIGPQGICAGTRSGAIVLWSGEDAWIGGSLEEPVRGLAHDDKNAFVIGERTLWRFAVVPVPGKAIRLAKVATLGADQRFGYLGARKGCVFGIVTPGAVPFYLSNEGLILGPSTGVVSGRRVLWRSDDGLFIAAGDGGELFSWRPGEALTRTEAFIPSLGGRRFLARWTAACSVADFMFGGTSDGYLFEYEPSTRSVRNLGKPDLSLGIRDLTAVDDGVVGIAGRDNDLCTVFGYSRRAGFVDYGTDVAGSMELSALVRLDELTIAIAESARIAHVNIYDFGGAPHAAAPAATGRQPRGNVA